MTNVKHAAHNTTNQQMAHVFLNVQYNNFIMYQKKLKLYFYKLIIIRNVRAVYQIVYFAIMRKFVNNVYQAFC